MTSPPEPRLARLGRFSVRRRRLVALAWLLLLVAALVGGPKIAGEWSANYSTPGSDSKAAAETLRSHFPNLTSDTLLFTWTAPDATAAPAQARVREVLAEVTKIPGIEAGDPSLAQISPNGKVGLIEVPLTALPSTIAIDDGPALLKMAEAATNDAVTIKLGGRVMQEVEQAGSVSSEGVGLAVALIILLLTFGTIVAAGLPIATALFGIGIGAALVGVVASIVDTPDWAESVATMVGIGVGIDYALLILTRYRTALSAGASTEDAVSRAIATAGRSVLVAGATVVISLLGLLLMRLPYLNGVAFSAGVTVLVIMAASLTLLPALLGFAGTKINALAIPVPGRARRARRGAARGAVTASKSSLPAEASPGFARWSRRVQRRPWVATLLGTAAIVIIAIPITGARIGFPGLGEERPGSQVRSSFDLLAEGFGPGVSAPLRLAIPLDSPDDNARIAKLATAIKSDPRVAVVHEPLIADDESTALLTVQSKTAGGTRGTDQLMEHLRDVTIPASGLDVKVGGASADTHDQSYATASRLPLLFLGVAGLSGLLLLAAFRSLLIPIKAAVMNLFSIAAAYGVVALVAEGGFFGGLIGIDGEVPIAPFVPVLMFAVLFGLSMDYEVFLLGRIRELFLEHGDAERAVTEGIATTARVITAAAAIMIAVFGAFVLSDQVFLKLIGIGMATAILVDATIIRLVLVPAVMGLLGKRAWWLPRWLDKLVPQAELEAPEPMAASRDAGGAEARATDDDDGTTPREPAVAGEPARSLVS